MRGLDEAPDRLRVLGDTVLARDVSQAEQRQAVVGRVENLDGVADAIELARLVRDEDREDVDLAFAEHTRIEAYLDLIDIVWVEAVGGGEGEELDRHRALVAELLTGPVLHGLDAGAGAHGESLLALLADQRNRNERQPVGCPRDDLRGIRRRDLDLAREQELKVLAGLGVLDGRR